MYIKIKFNSFKNIMRFYYIYYMCEINCKYTMKLYKVYNEIYRVRCPNLQRQTNATEM